nr:MAG: phosphoenolpyruvate synthase/pyruvate phosphate dikinase [Candidatus Nanosalinarum sp. J07AB56]
MRIEEIERNTDWELYVSRENVLLWRYMAAIGYRSGNLQDKLDVKVELSNKMTDKHNFFDPSTVGRLSKQIESEVEDDIDYFLSIANECYDSSEEFLELCKQIEDKNLSECTDEELKSIFEEYVDKNASLLPYRAAGFVLDRILEQKLENRFEEHEIDFYKDTITPEKELPFLEERKSLLEIGEEVEENEELAEVLQNSECEQVWQELPDKLRKMIQNHLNHFEWITTDRYTGEPLTRQDVIENLSKIIGRSSESLEKIQSNREEKLEQLEKTKEAGDEEFEKLLDIAREYAYFRTYRMDVIYEGDYRVRNMFEEIARRAGLDYRDLIHLTVPEIKEALRGKEITEDLVDSRREEYIVYLVGDEISVIEGEEAKEHISELETEGSEDAKRQASIEGTVAQRGQVESEVRLVFEDEDVEKVREGDILVSPMTTPDMMVGIMDAEGIVTDEGGVASHAAIVSRELGIPCVIGTEVATSVLQDGDKVRIDGETGIVEILDT